MAGHSIPHSVFVIYNPKWQLFYDWKSCVINSPGLMQDMPQMPSHRHFLRGLRQSSSARHFRKHTRPCVRRDSIAIRTILRRRVVACDEITARMNSVRGKKTTTNLSLGEIFVARARIRRDVAWILKGFPFGGVGLNW